MLSIESIERGYAGFDLGPVDLIVEDEVVAVLGPSGCGKTTLLSIVAGLVEPSAGRVELHGAEITGLPPERRGTALLFQDGALFPHLTARENIAYAAPSPDRVDGIAERLEITDVLARRPAALSGGQRSRVALARAIAADPDALLLDEPLGSLDTPVARRLRRVMREVLRDLDAPAIYVTHDQQEALTFADQVTVMDVGRAVQTGSPQELHERPEVPFVGYFIGSPGMNLFDAERDADGLRLGEVRLPLSGEQQEALEPADGSLQVGIRPEFVDARPAAFEGAREGEVRGVDLTGHALIAHIDGAGLSFKAKLPEDADVRIGGSVWFTFPRERLMVYAAGRRVEGLP